VVACALGEDEKLSEDSEIVLGIVGSRAYWRVELMKGPVFTDQSDSDGLHCIRGSESSIVELITVALLQIYTNLEHW
jgi:hypothetical protein